MSIQLKNRLWAKNGTPSATSCGNNSAPMSYTVSGGTRSITAGKSVDRMIGSSEALTDVKETFFNSDPEYFRKQVKSWIDQFGITSEDLKNLGVTALLARLAQGGDTEKAAKLKQLLAEARKLGLD